MHYKIGVQLTHVLYSVVTISQFNSLCKEFTSAWSMCIYNMTVTSVIVFS